MDRWQSERHAPAFTLMSTDICRDLDADGFDLAIVGAVRPDVLPAVFKALNPAGNPVLFVCDEKQPAHEGRQMQPCMSFCDSRKAGWMRWCWSPRKSCGTDKHWHARIAPSSQ